MERILICPKTKITRIKSGKLCTCEELIILNPSLILKSIEDNNKYILAGDTIKLIYKIKDTILKEKILKIDSKRKEYKEHGSTNTLPDLTSSEDLKQGNFKRTQSSYILYGIRTGI